MDNQGENRCITVTRAVIEKNGEILAAQRNKSRSLPLKWEFPGGKMKAGESPKDCITREIKEELNLEIDIVDVLPQHFHKRGNRVFELIPFICRISGGYLMRREHEDVIWDRPEELESLDWAEADMRIYNEYLKYLKEI